MSAKPILCVDFDGVVHSYTSGWQGATVIPDPPVTGALRWLWKATEWWNVQIYSSRSKDPVAREAMQAWMIVHSREEFGLDHPMSDMDGERDPGFQYPITFAYEKPSAFLTIDDRAICFDGDWSEIDACDLLNFKPWNKRVDPAVPALGLGATNVHPQGHVGDDDQGELRMAVGYDKLMGIVRLEFGKPVAWLGLPPPEARALAEAILAKLP